LVNPENTLEIAEAMRRLAKNAALRRRLLTAGLSRAKNFSWEKFGKEVKREIKLISYDKIKINVTWDSA